MRRIDVFNGDADGICALIQWRLARPAAAEPVTGVKRDIRLLAKIQDAQDAAISVLDISLDSNRQDLERLLRQGAQVFYVDHHYCGDLPVYPNLTTLIDPSPDACTSLLMHAHLQHAYPGWAAAGAFGDNLDAAARRVLQPLALPKTQIEQLQQLGEAVNYNAYGEDLDDLLLHPAELYRRLAVHPWPLDFCAAEAELWRALSETRQSDLQLALQQTPDYQGPGAAAVILPDAQWARRINGSFGNHLAKRHPQRAHAIITHHRQGGYQISVRAPLNRPAGADALCRRYPGGGGRQAAAGVNQLPPERLDEFLRDFAASYNQPA